MNENKTYTITYGVDEQRMNLPDAVYISNNGKDSLLFMYKDYLGSLVALTDNTGTVLERYAYDPWGNRRNPDNWTQKDTRSSWRLNRGYTMHEHLDAFGIINMNGRVYDPLTAQFFSPDPYLQAPGNWLNYNRYSYVLNNPMKYTDPSGEFAWLPLIFFAVQNGLMQGAMADMNGGNFWDGAWKGALVGAATYGLGSIAPLGTTWVGSTVWGAAVGTAASAGNVWASGGNDYSNIWTGTLTGAVSGFLTSEEFGNMLNGKGFNSNQKVYENIMFSAYNNPEINWRQEVLDYFGFEGKYDPDFLESGGFNPETQSITYGPSAFGGRGNSYSRLRAIYEEELFHSMDFLKYKNEAPDWMKNETNEKHKKSLLYNYEEWRAQNHLYKNQGLYSKSGIDWVQRTNYWGIQAEVYDMHTPLFTPKWWHFIYKIPRRW